MLRIRFLYTQRTARNTKTSLPAPNFRFHVLWKCKSVVELQPWIRYKPTCSIPIRSVPIIISSNRTKEKKKYRAISVLRGKLLKSAGGGLFGFPAKRVKSWYEARRAGRQGLKPIKTWNEMQIGVACPTRVGRTSPHCA